MFSLKRKMLRNHQCILPRCCWCTSCLWRHLTCCIWECGEMVKGALGSYWLTYYDNACRPQETCITCVQFPLMMPKHLLREKTLSLWRHLLPETLGIFTNSFDHQSSASESWITTSLPSLALETIEIILVFPFIEATHHRRRYLFLFMLTLELGIMGYMSNQQQLLFKITTMAMVNILLILTGWKAYDSDPCHPI